MELFENQSIKGKRSRKKRNYKMSTLSKTGIIQANLSQEVETLSSASKLFSAVFLFPTLLADFKDVIKNWDRVLVLWAHIKEYSINLRVIEILSFRKKPYYFIQQDDNRKSAL